MKSLILAAVFALSLAGHATTASADTFTVHGVWDQIWAEKQQGK